MIYGEFPVGALANRSFMGTGSKVHNPPLSRLIKGARLAQVMEAVAPIGPQRGRPRDPGALGTEPAQSVKGLIQLSREKAHLPESLQSWLKNCLIPIIVDEFMAQRERKSDLASTGPAVRQSAAEVTFPRLEETR